MRRILIALFVVLSAACDTPHNRNPIGPGAVPTGSGSPLSDVSGSWKGSIRFSYPDDWVCPGGSQATAEFRQDGPQVRGVIHSKCFEEEFNGTLDAGQLTGTVKVTIWSDVYKGEAAGSATTASFYLGTNELARNGGQPISGYRITFSR